ncbi:MAG: hypothetical protein WCJ66_13615 [Verrucomicrobiota bacterium]
MADDNPTFELKEPAALEGLLPRDDSQAGWLAAALLALLVLGIWFIPWLRRLRGKRTAGTRRDLAYYDASAALQQITAADARAAAVQSSLILRRYLSLAAEDPALFETHEEFVARNDALLALSESARAACADGFTRLAACKYAAEVSALEPAAVVGDARGLLETLHRGFRS